MIRPITPLMSLFTETLAAFGAAAIVLVSVIVFLTLFYRALAWISSIGSKSEAVSVRGVLSKRALANVHVAMDPTGLPSFIVRRDSVLNDRSFQADAPRSIRACGVGRMHLRYRDRHWVRPASQTIYRRG